MKPKKAKLPPVAPRTCPECYPIDPKALLSPAGLCPCCRRTWSHDGRLVVGTPIGNLQMPSQEGDPRYKPLVF